MQRLEVSCAVRPISGR